MIKKTISIILAALMLASFFSIAASATAVEYSISVENGYAEKLIFNGVDEDFVPVNQQDLNKPQGGTDLRSQNNERSG